MQYGIYQIKNVKTDQRLSEETQFFSLDLYVNGRKFCAVSNDGRGGCHRVHTYPPFTHKDIAEQEALMKQDDFLIEHDYEPFDEAVSSLLSLYETQKALSKYAKTKIVMLEDNQLMTLAVNKGVDPASLLGKARGKYPAATILNDMDPCEAAKLVVKAERIQIEKEMQAFDSRGSSGIKP